MTILESLHDIDIYPDFPRIFFSFAYCPSIIINSNSFHPQAYCTLVWMMDDKISQGENQGRSKISRFHVHFNFVFVICNVVLLVNYSFVWFKQCSFLHILLHIDYTMKSKIYMTLTPGVYNLRRANRH